MYVMISYKYRRIDVADTFVYTSFRTILQSYQFVFISFSSFGIIWAFERKPTSQIVRIENVKFQVLYIVP